MMKPSINQNAAIQVTLYDKYQNIFVFNMIFRISVARED